MPHPSDTQRVAVVSTYPPRRCGLATYTSDLRSALRTSAADLEIVIAAIDRDEVRHGPEVVTVIDQDDEASYRRAARALADLDVDVVLIQHEYGIFGGPEGDYALALASELNVLNLPYLVTLHTVLSQPTTHQFETLRTLCQGAARVTVFTESARRAAAESGLVDAEKLVVVPHGAPPELLDPDDPPSLRSDIAELNGPVLTTFGLLSPGKGLETAIEAIARLVPRHPEIRYVIAGQTHPEVARRFGEAYRDTLRALIERLGVREHVVFIDAFLSVEELGALLRRTTVFVTPYRSPEQTCSGALTFGLAAGCPVVSTGYQYAEDLLADGAGTIVPFEDPDATAAALAKLFEDEGELSRTRNAAMALGSRLTWPAVAVLCAAELREVADPDPHVPELRLDHLRELTDELGIIQFSRIERPDEDSGYCVDDVARLGIVAADMYAIGREPEQALSWVSTTLRFIDGADAGSAGLYNMMSYQGAWLDEPHLADHVGRAIWGVGTIAGTPSLPRVLRERAVPMLDRMAALAPELAELFPRTSAYAILGLTRCPRPENRAALELLVDRLDAQWRRDATPQWPWPEDGLTYDNARLIEAMLAGGAELGRPEVTRRALESLDWYIRQVELDGGRMRCIGNSWRHRDDLRADDEGDEQPLDVAAMVEALIQAWRYTGIRRYATLAVRAFGWFLGHNRAGIWLYNEETGACHDGLSADAPNLNRGAESTLAYYQAMLSVVRHGLADLPEPERGEGGAPIVRDLHLHRRARRTARNRTRRGIADARRTAE